MLLLSKHYQFVMLFILGLLLNGELLASQTYWLSDTPPSKEILKKMRSSHDGLVQRSRKDGTSKRLWLRSGEDPVKSSYVKEFTAPLVLLDATKSLQTVTFSNQDYTEAKFKMPDEGFYNLFMINNFVENSTLYSITAKKETLNHSCREGHAWYF